MKELLIIAFVFAYGNPFFAQKMFAGPEIGINLIQVQKQDIGNDFQPGYYLGGAFEYQFKKWFSIKSGIYLSQTHQAFTSADTTAFDFFGLVDSSFTIPGLDLNTYSTSEGRQNQAYIQIPILANYKWKGFNVSAGGYLGFMIHANRKEHIISTTPFMNTFDLESFDSTGFLSSFFPKPYEETFVETSNTDNLRGFDYGLKFGLGYEFNKVNINCSYNCGFPDYRIDRGADNSKVHQFFQISVSYLLGIKRKDGVSKIR